MSSDSGKSDKITIFEEIIIGDYVCNKLIGSGAFSDIYLGVGVNASVYPQNIALKKIYLDRLGTHRDKIFREIKVMQRMKHRNVLNIINYIIKDNTAYLILEYCNHGDLTNLWTTNEERTSGLSLSVTHSIFSQIVDGFLYLKSVDPSIIHRDIKLENILLHKKKNGELVAKIADFGFCLFGEIDTAINMTVCGSPMYMAPELFLCDRVYNDKIDIWSLGIILYKMHYGYNKHPFGNIQSISDIINAFQSLKTDTSVIHIPEQCDKCEGEGVCNISKLVREMLVLNSGVRINWADIATRPFLVNPPAQVKLPELRTSTQPIPIPIRMPIRSPSAEGSLVGSPVIGNYIDHSQSSRDYVYTPVRQQNSANGSVADFMYRLVWGYK